MQRFNVSGCQKKVYETNGYEMTTVERPTYLVSFLIAQRIIVFAVFLKFSERITLR